MIKTLVIIYFIITALVFCIVLAILVKDKFMSRKYNRITVFISYLRFILLKNFYKKIIVGASGRNIKGYLATEQRYLDITNDDWKKYFDSSSLDEIIAEHVFEHLENPDIAFYNCWQMLKPGGKLVLAVPDGDDPEQVKKNRPPNFGHKKMFNLSSLTLSLEANGFTKFKKTTNPKISRQDSLIIEATARTITTPV